MFKNLFTHRRYLFGSFWTEFRFRYAGTALGIFWFVVNPILEAAIYSVVFSYLLGLRSQAGRGVSYTLFLVIGLLPWLAFSTMLTHGSNVLNSSSAFLRRLAIPTEIFVAKESLISMLSLVVYIVVLLFIGPFLGGKFTWNLLILPVLIVLFVLLGYGFSLVLSHLRVFFPDIGEILGVLVQLWRWTLPINYSTDILPGWLSRIFKFNPPYYFITSFRDLFLDGRFPEPIAWFAMIAWVTVLLLLGSLITHRLGTEVKDQL